MNKIEQAKSLFSDGYLCSQSILITYAPRFGLEPEMAAKIGAPFGGGIARRGDICGAVNGAFMVLGLKYGHLSPDDQETKEEAYRKVEEFISDFQERYGSIRCKELLEIDIRTPQGLQSAYDQQLFTTRCPRFVGDAVEILDQLMGDDQDYLQSK
jgi:C_GCAxxG_C_C family probable redox protein